MLKIIKKIKSIAFVTGMILICISPQAKASLSVLLYHQVSDTKRYGISEENFKQQMDYLRENGFTFLSHEQLLVAFNKEVDFSDKKYVAVTFDDGWRSQMKAVTIMSERKIPAIFFINGEPIASKWGGYFTKEHLKEIESNPLFTIADHSYSHQIKILHNHELLKDDYKKNIEFLKNNLKVYSLVYAYPYGSKTKEYLDYLKEQNVQLIYGTSGVKIHNTTKTSKYDIPRFTITNSVTFEQFKKYVN